MKKTDSGKSTKKGKTFYMDEADLLYVQKLSVELGQKRGKNVPESEALRLIIDHYRQGHSAGGVGGGYDG